MRLSEFNSRIRRQKYNKPPAGLKNFLVKLKLNQGGYTQMLDTTVMARTPEMAARIIKKQYDNKNVIVGRPREIKE